jgi:hypothetical protein
VPAGKHTIEFKFEPKVFNTCFVVSKYAGWLLFLLLIAFAAYAVKKSMGKKDGDA